MQFYVVWLLTALASVVLGAAAPPVRADSEAGLVSGVSRAIFGVPVAGAIVGALAALLGWSVSTGALAGLVIALALLALLTPRYSPVARFGAALLAMQAAVHLFDSGVPMVLALLVGATFALLPAWLQTRGAGFAPARMQEEALLIVLALALVLGAAPEIESGWRSAMALNANAGQGADASPIPMWALGALGAAVLIGCVSRMLRRS